MFRDTELQEIVDRVVPGARLVGHRPLTGGVSADAIALDLSPARRIVLRMQRDHSSPDNSAVQYGVLRALHRVGFPVPEPLWLDVSGERLPRPFFVMELVEGTTEPPAAPILPMAALLARVHALPHAELGLPPLPERDDPREGIREWYAGAAVIEGLDWEPAAPTLLHGDYWAGNLLWRDGVIRALLDWEDCAIGDPLSDLACARIELLWRFDWDAVAAFTDAYLAATGLDPARLPVWDLYVGSAAARYMGDWGLDPAVVERMRARTADSLARAHDAVRCCRASQVAG